MPNETSIKYALLADFIRSLEAEDFAFGIDKHLQLQALLVQVPDDISFADLKQVLCPIIATNEQEQALVYTIFDHSVARVKATHQVREQSPTLTTQKQSNWLPWAASILLILLIPLGIIIINPDVVEPSDVVIAKYFSVAPDSTYQICLDSIDLANCMLPLQGAYICADSAQTGESTYGTYSLLDSICLNYTAKDSLGKDSICITLLDKDATRFQLIIRPSIQRDTIAYTQPVPKNEQALFQTKEYRPQTGFNSLRIEPLSTWQRFYHNNSWWLKLIFIYLVGMFLAILLKWRENQKRKLIAEISSSNAAPHIWSVQPNEVPTVQLDGEFDALLNNLRQRTQADHYKLDLKQTIKATIERGGMIDFKYAVQTRPPEYLLLIDRQTGDNHRAHLFQFLAEQFEDNEVHIDYFFYDNDLRLAWNEDYPDGLPIKELHHLHPDARLMLVGNAYQLLSPLSGQLAKWTGILTQWKERVIFTPIPTTTWGRRERHLEELAVVLPASLQSVHFWIEELEEGEEAEFDRWKERVTDAHREPILLQGSLVESLRANFEPKMLEWIAACAVYPSLHWSLTLQLGEQLSTPDVPLLTIERLNDLNRLPWFIDGKIPTDARATLVAWLEAERPELLREVRMEIRNLLRQNPPPRNSAAWEDYQMNASLNEWLITTERSRKDELEQEISQQLQAGIEPDFTILKYINRPVGPLDFIVPKSWRKFASEELEVGSFFQRIRNAAQRASHLTATDKVAQWSVVVWLFFAISILSWTPEFVGQNCGYELSVKSESDSTSVCLQDGSDFFAVQEHLTRKAIQYKEWVYAEGLAEITKVSYEQGRAMWFEGTTDSTHIQVDVKTLEQLDFSTAEDAYQSYQANIIADYWNLAVGFYQQIRNNSNPNDSIYITKRDSACFFFTKAWTMMDSTNTDRERAIAWCTNQLDAYFTMDTDSCCAPCIVRFTNNSVGAQSYRWDFDDGEISTDANPTHEFRRAGEYTVSLYATDSLGKSEQHLEDISICVPQRSSTGRQTKAPIYPDRPGSGGKKPTTAVDRNRSTDVEKETIDKVEEIDEQVEMVEFRLFVREGKGKQMRPVTNYQVTITERRYLQEEPNIQTIDSEESELRVNLKANQTYDIRVRKEGYEENSILVETGTKVFREQIFLTPIKEVPLEEPELKWENPNYEESTVYEATYELRLSWKVQTYTINPKYDFNIRHTRPKGATNIILLNPKSEELKAELLTTPLQIGQEVAKQTINYYNYNYTKEVELIEGTNTFQAVFTLGDKTYNSSKVTINYSAPRRKK